MRTVLARIALRTEQDVVLCRRLVRESAEALGFGGLEQTRIATAVSEIARNAYVYAREAEAELTLEAGPPAALGVKVSDRGPGIEGLDAILEGRYQSQTGLGLGLVGARRLMDRFAVRTDPAGTVVELAQLLGRGQGLPAAPALRALQRRLQSLLPVGPLDDLRSQNAALVEALAALEERQGQLDRLNRELEETNHGVVALYAELDDKAEALRRASELKSRFLQHVSHEFRTPLNSMLSLSQLLLEEADGPLSPEQGRQVRFIRQSAEVLSELINDMLDLAKIEAGKTDLRPRAFAVGELLATLRGMLRPLRSDATVQLSIDAAEDLPRLWTDDGKLAQILRNLVSNALKFTEHGEVRVSARRGAGGTLVLSVQDTGVGIAPEHHERIFEEFTQVAGAHQKVKGTGLGLPLSRRLAQLLGGTVTVHSALGQGSTFTASVAGIAPGLADVPPELALAWRLEPGLAPVFLLSAEGKRLEQPAEGRALREAGFQLLPFHDLAQLREALGRSRPAAVLVEGALPAGQLHPLLQQLQAQGPGAPPLLGLGPPGGPELAGVESLPPGALEDGTLLARLQRPEAPARDALLVIDDDEVFRYLLRKLLEETPYRVLEASSGEEGLLLARSQRPALVFLDLVMPGMGAGAVLDALQADPGTRDIPVIVQSARRLAPGDLEHLRKRVRGFLPKQHLTRETVLHQLDEVLGQPPSARQGVPPPAPQGG